MLSAAKAKNAYQKSLMVEHKISVYLRRDTEPKGILISKPKLRYRLDDGTKNLQRRPFFGYGFPILDVCQFEARRGAIDHGCAPWEYAEDERYVR